ncbi:MAG: hypothetical protein IJE05_04455 [Clostridia bacterium]|nr:hypothetical protein [Clostridia bacterium]
MNAQDFRKLLEKTDDKLSIFASAETLKKYHLNLNEFFDLISDFLSDEEKLELFEYSHFQQFDGRIKGNIIKLVSDENIILRMMSNDNIMNGFENYEIVNIIKKMSDNSKQQILRNQEFIEKHQIADYELKNIVLSLTEEARAEMLTDIDLITNKLHLANFQIVDLTKGLSSEEAKNRILEIYQLANHQKIAIINTFSSNHKIDILLKEKCFNKYDMMDILKSLDIKNLNDFLVKHKDFYSENNIHPYEIIHELDTEQQKDFVANLENINLTLSEKKEILATLKVETKQNIDTTILPEEYKTALSIQTTEYAGRVILDLERDLEDYRGLDNLMRINPEEFTKEQRTKFMQLCDICPNLQVVSILNDTVEYISTAGEYKEAEEWITSIMDNLNPEYSKAQKMAIIDNAIGKKISYSPDFDTEVFDESDCRALWKIISSGYGVCNGIAKVEQYMLNRIGIESEIISSDAHTFLKIKDIELPIANGEIAKGNTILDPTWNLTRHRFGGKPDNFCISYEQARKNDIDTEGKDHNCHKDDEKLQDATLNLDEQSLRKLFTSVGLADREGQFPIKDLLEKSKLLDEFYANQPNQNINKQFLLMSQVCPEFATCQNSSMSILSDILLNNENLKFNKCVVNRVYNRTDKEKRPILFVYIDSNELGKNFYFADKDRGQFVELPQEEFTKQFECYQEDLENYKRT